MLTGRTIDTFLEGDEPGKLELRQCDREPGSVDAGRPRQVIGAGGADADVLEYKLRIRGEGNCGTCGRLDAERRQNVARRQQRCRAEAE